jgi:hypothetical protein
MESKGFVTLNIDSDFKNLIRPLQKHEYLQLEANLISDGCRDPIICWNGLIIDGHNRYEICTRHQIPYAVTEMAFDCREAAIAWICANQLGRRNITQETRKFLIGMQYESEKLANAKKNARGKNQYGIHGSEKAEIDVDLNKDIDRKITRHITAQRIAEQNDIANGTVQKYAIYTRALETIGQKAPDMVPKILSGRCKISHHKVVELSRLDPEEIKRVGNRIERRQQPFGELSNTRHEITKSVGQTSTNATQQIPSVKDMPTFDPDGEITALTLTIPSWGSTIDRARERADLKIVSDAAKNKLALSLTNLQVKITNLLSAIREEDGSK